MTKQRTAGKEATGKEAAGKPTANNDAGDDRTVIKKYANRRLYNTATSRYVTLDDLCAMVKADEDFAVIDARSGTDITRSVLTQIIVEQEAKGANLLPINFLRQLISLYDGKMQWLVPAYLERSMESFHANQARMHDYMSKAFGGMFGLHSLEEMSQQNMALFEQALRMFSPFPAAGDETSAQSSTGDDDHATEAELKALREQMQQVSEQLASMQSKNKS